MCIRDSHSSPLGQNSSKHNILRRADAREGQADCRSMQRPFRRAGEAAVILDNLRPHLPQSRKMQINRPWAKLTPARKGQNRPSGARKDRTQKDDGGAHFTHKPVRDIALRHTARIDRQASSLPGNGTAKMAQDPRGNVHVGQVRTIM